MPENINPYAPPANPGSGMLPPGAQVFAPCPNCRNVYAKRIGYTLWGGALGPWLFTHVRCCQCGTAYNGKTGLSNTTNIVIYMLVPVAVAGVALLGMIAAALFKM